MKPQIIFKARNVFLALSLFMLVPVRGAVFDTFGPGDSFQVGSADFVNDGANTLKAFAYRFEAQENAPGVILEAALFSQTDENRARVKVEVWSHNSGDNLPLSSLDEMITQPLATQTEGSLLTLTLPNAQLNQGNNYWLSFTFESGGQADWHLNNQGVESWIAVGDDTSPGEAPDTWRPASGTGNEPQNFDTITAFRLTAVPEPREYALVAGLGLAVFGVVRRLFSGAGHAMD